MPSVIRLAALAALTLAVGCTSAIEVRTITAPNASLTGIRTFRILSGPMRRDGRPATGADDPMVSNSIANRAIRERVAHALYARGYTLDETNADVGVAIYASAREKLDVTDWDYGYPAYPRWPDRVGTTRVVTRYTEGTVVIDLVTRNGALLWRGAGTIPLSDDPLENIKQLGGVAEKVVGKLPHASPQVIAGR